MAEKFDLIADYREDAGKGASRRLRHQGKVPAIIYGAGRPPRSLSFDHNKVMHQLASESFYSSVLNIKVGDKSQAAILKDVQRHPSKQQVLHLDFQRIVEDEVIRMNVPIHFIGGEVAIGVKEGGGLVDQAMWELSVVCLPTKIPEKIEADVTELNIGDAIHVKDIVLPEGVITKHDPEAILVSVVPPMKDVEVPEEGEEEGEPEVIGEKKEGEEGEEKGEEKGEGKPEEKAPDKGDEKKSE